MIYRTLGSTGQKVSAIGLGGFHIGNPVLESESLKIPQCYRPRHHVHG